MKRKLLGTLTLLIIVIAGALSPVAGFFISEMAPSVAHAQAALPVGVGAPDPNASTTTYYAPGGSTTGVGATPDPNAPAAAATTAATTTTTGTGEINNQNPQTPILKCGINIVCGFFMIYSTMVLFLPNLLASLGGVFLDYTLWSTLQSATYTTQDNVDSFVVKGWKLVRDFSNLLFIFALFVVAFSLILNGDAEGKGFLGLEPKRTIVRVIIVALLVNFSFFMCRAIIDVTNIFGNVFYTKISTVDPGSLANVSQSNQNASQSGAAGSMGKVSDFYASNNLFGIRSVSLPILDNVNPQQLIFNNDNKPDGGWTSLFGVPSYDMGLYVLISFIATLSGFFNLFLLYIFVSSAIFLIARTIGLYFLIILSPLAFVSTTIPALQSKEYFGFDDWFKQLTGLAFSAPIFVFFLYLAVIFLKIPTLPVKDSGYLLKAISVIIKLALTGSVLIFGKKIAIDLSGKLGAMAGNAITQVSKAVAIGAVTGGAAYAAGGASGVFQMGKRFVGQQTKGVGENIGRSVLGDAKIDALLGNKEKNIPRRWDSIMSFNPNFKAIKDVALAGTTPGFGSDLGAALKYGKFGNRKADMEGAKKAAEKAKKAKEASDKEATKDVDKRAENLEKDYKANLIDQKTYKEEKVKLANEKKAILDPVAAKNNAAKETQKKVEEKEAANKKDKVPEKLAAANEKLTAANEKLAQNVTTIAAATGTMNKAIQDQTAAEVEATRNRNLLATQTGPQNEHIATLRRNMNERTSVGDVLGASQIQDEITKEEQGYAAQNKPLVDAIAKAETEKARHATTKAEAQATIEAATRESAQLTAAKPGLEAEKTALEAKVKELDDLKETLAGKKEEVDRTKELSNLDKELAKRGVSTKDVRGSDGEISHQITTYADKADTRNATQTKMVIDEINARKEAIQNMSTEDKLKDIFADVTHVDQLKGGDFNHTVRVMQKYKDADPTPKTSKRFSDGSMN